jgi:hypothetical protein
MDITTILGDDELVSIEQTQELLGPPGKKLSRRTVSRLINQPDGLPYVDVGGHRWLLLSGIREFLRKRTCRPNRRRKAA